MTFNFKKSRFKVKIRKKNLNDSLICVLYTLSALKTFNLKVKVRSQMLRYVFSDFQCERSK